MNSVNNKKPISLKEAWEVIRQDLSNNRFRVPLPDGRKKMSQEEAEKYAKEMQDKGHHQDYEARPYDPNDLDLMEW